MRQSCSRCKYGVRPTRMAPVIRLSEKMIGNKIAVWLQTVIKFVPQVTRGAPTTWRLTGVHASWPCLGRKHSHCSIGHPGKRIWPKPWPNLPLGLSTYVMAIYSLYTITQKISPSWRNYALNTLGERKRERERLAHSNL